MNGTEDVPLVHQNCAKARAANIARAEAKAAEVLPIVLESRAAGCTTLRQIADALAERGIVTRRGGRWHISAVKKLLDRSR